MRRHVAVALSALAALISVAAIGVSIAVASHSARAPVPQVVSYGGALIDVNGKPVADGEHLVKFRLYGSPTGGVPVWDELQTVTTAGGRFEVLLGSVNAFGNAFDTYPLFLTFQMDGGVEQPRKQLASVPFAIRAADADTLDGRPASDYALAGHTHPGGSGDISGVAAGTGLVGGGETGDVSLAVAPAYQLPQGCGGGQIPAYRFAFGAGFRWMCADDADTGADAAVVQRRVSGTCSDALLTHAIREVRQDGSVDCTRALASAGHTHAQYAANNHTHPLPGVFVRRVSEDVAVFDSVGRHVIVASCRDGEVVTGGGFRIQGGPRDGGRLPPVRIDESKPDVLNGEWEVTAFLHPGTQLFAYAVCLSLRP